MKLLSINVSLAKEISHAERTVTTGIFKEPVEKSVMVRRLKIDGDAQADRKVHGGFDMAVYAYPVEHYAYWESALGHDGYPYGQFGENLSVEGLLEETVRVGDVLRIGGAVLQVTQPRIPCYKLAIRMAQDTDFAKRFQDSGRLGFYLRVLEEGEIGVGDPVQLIETDASSVTIAEFISVYLHKAHEPESLKRVLESRDLGEAWRLWIEKMLKKAEPVIRPNGWEGYRTFVVDRKCAESEIITSFYLKPKDGKSLPDFLPGQFLTFRLEIPGHDTPVTRTYTLSDSPHSDYYRVSIKREPTPVDRPDLAPGLSSNYFHDHVNQGTELCVRAPRGEFWLDPADDTPIVLLSGGVGLTPMISMLNAVVASGSNRAVWFVHGSRNGRQHAMGAHVRRLAADHPNVHVHICYSRPKPQDKQASDFDGAGHVTVDVLKDLLPPAAYDFYVCGPVPFMKSLYDGLLDWGVAESRIHYEFFGPQRALKEGVEAAKAATQTTGEFRLTFTRAGVSAPWDASFASILDFAEAKGLRPDYSCRSGICHTCMTRIVEGEVEYTVDLADRPDPGSVLICCSQPKTDVVLDL